MIPAELSELVSLFRALPEVHVRQFIWAMLCVRVIVCVHNSFASYGGDVIRDCHANKAQCQRTRTLSNLIT